MKDAGPKPGDSSPQTSVGVMWRVEHTTMTTIELKAIIDQLGKWHDYLSDGPDDASGIWELECRACVSAMRALADVRDERAKKAEIEKLQSIIDPWDGAYPSDYKAVLSGVPEIAADDLDDEAYYHEKVWSGIED